MFQDKELVYISVLRDYVLVCCILPIVLYNFLRASIWNRNKMIRQTSGRMYLQFYMLYNTCMLAYVAGRE
jgi:hypothetical protein